MTPKLRELIANMAIRDTDNTYKGAVGELFARKWFEYKNIKYYQFPQSPATKPISLKRVGGKRPDFAISINNMDSLVYIDAKFHKTNGVTEFCLKNEELNQYKAFREWIKVEHGDDGDRDIIMMLYPQELNGSKFTRIHIDDLIAGIPTEVDGKPGKKVSLLNSELIWENQDEGVA